MAAPLKPVLIMAGGTGGHVYPALAVAEFLRDRGIPLFWLGTRAGLESRVVPENDISLFTVRIVGLRGKKLSRRLLAPVTLAIAMLQSLRILLRLRPSAVIGLGGFVAGPGGIAAWLLRIPLLIHEQNAIAGLTNRLLAPFARTVMTGFPGVLAGKKAVTTGNPVRKDILQAAQPPAQRMADSAHRPLRLLVLGGSLGAHALNEILPRAVSALPGGLEVELWHQTGTSHYQTTLDLYSGCRLQSLRVTPYIENMGEAYAWADLVVCRAGALTVSELCVAGTASILVPFPHAVDDHQTANARYLCDAGGAVLVPQEDLSTARLVELICDFNLSRNKLLEMGIAVRKKALPDAAADIGRICLEVIHA